MRKFGFLIAALMLFAPVSVEAGFIPIGLQSSVSQATVDSWGWTEIHRSYATQSTSEAAIVAAATGDYLMMGVWDRALQVYSILGAGETSVVTAITYQDYTGDDNQNYNPNWSNGLNFYRTSGHGSWGFTTNLETQLSSADILLQDGTNNFNGNSDPVPSAGLSFHNHFGLLTNGWAMNATGNDFEYITFTLQDGLPRFQRTFFITDAPTTTPVPEPTSMALVGFAGVGMAIGAWRKRRQQKRSELRQTAA